MLAAAPAFADATLFIGSTTTPANRATKGFAVGVGLLIVGFEFEYADTSEIAGGRGAVAADRAWATSCCRRRFPIAGMQFYFTTGAGVYRETPGTSGRKRMSGFNTGGGVKMSLLGPLRARLDYRVFKLRGEPLHSVVHRIYAGVNLAF